MPAVPRRGTSAAAARGRLVNGEIRDSNVHLLMVSLGVCRPTHPRFQRDLSSEPALVAQGAHVIEGESVTWSRSAGRGGRPGHGLAPVTRTARTAGPPEMLANAMVTGPQGSAQPAPPVLVRAVAIQRSPQPLARRAGRTPMRRRHRPTRRPHRGMGCDRTDRALPPSGVNDGCRPSWRRSTASPARAKKRRVKEPFGHREESLGAEWVGMQRNSASAAWTGSSGSR
jgi:hypothetical protein